VKSVISLPFPSGLSHILINVSRPEGKDKDEPGLFDRRRRGICVIPVLASPAFPLICPFKREESEARMAGRPFARWWERLAVLAAILSLWPRIVGWKHPFWTVFMYVMLAVMAGLFLVNVRRLRRMGRPLKTESRSRKSE
jgi:hypothetical protein